MVNIFHGIGQPERANHRFRIQPPASRSADCSTELALVLELGDTRCVAKTAPLDNYVNVVMDKPISSQYTGEGVALFFFFSFFLFLLFSLSLSLFARKLAAH
jgi:hypothetical protein